MAYKTVLTQRMRSDVMSSSVQVTDTNIDNCTQRCCYSNSELLGNDIGLPIDCLIVGLLLCKNDTICVPPHELCDGVTHCNLHHDDELMCQRTVCADGCRCSGALADCIGPDVPYFALSTTLKVISMTEINIENIKTLLPIAKLSDIYLLSVHNSYIFNSNNDNHSLFNIKTIHTLLITNSFIGRLREKAFDLMPRLAMIDIRSSVVTSLQSYAFHGLLNLKYIRLFNCSITEIQSFTFCTAFSVTKLNLSANHLTSIKKNTFVCLNNLQYLDIRHNPITHIADGSTPNMVKSVIVNNIYLCCHIACLKRCSSRVNITLNTTEECKPIMADNWYTKICIVCLAIIILFINGCGFILVIISKSTRNGLGLITSMTLADMIMGIYLLSIFIMDSIHLDSPAVVHGILPTSGVCMYLSSLPVLSIFMSRTLVSVIAIRHLLHTRCKNIMLTLQTSSKGIITVSHLFLWAISIMISLLVSFYYQVLEQSCLLSHGLLLSDRLFWVAMSVTVLYPGVLFVLNSYIYYMIWKYCTEIRHAAGKSNPRSFVRNVGIILLNSCVNFLSGVLLTLMHVVDKKTSTDGVIEMLLVLFVIAPSIGNPCVYIEYKHNFVWRKIHCLFCWCIRFRRS